MTIQLMDVVFFIGENNREESGFVTGIDGSKIEVYLLDNKDKNIENKNKE